MNPLLTARCVPSVCSGCVCRSEDLASGRREWEALHQAGKGVVGRMRRVLLAGNLSCMDLDNCWVSRILLLCSSALGSRWFGLHCNISSFLLLHNHIWAAHTG